MGKTSIWLLILVALVPGCFGRGQRREREDTLRPLVLFEPQPGLVLLHRYDGDLLDASGRGHDGIGRGEPTFVPACEDRALRLDGVDDEIVVPSTPKLQPQVVSVEVFFQPASTLTGGATFEPLVVKLPAGRSFGTAVDGYDLVYQDPWGEGGRLTFGIGSEHGTRRIQASAFVDIDSAGYHHVVGTYDLHVIRLYLDGHLVASRAHVAPIAYLGGPLHIGGNIHHGLLAPSEPSRWFQGSFDALAIWDRVLSPDDIRARARAYERSCSQARDAG